MKHKEYIFVQLSFILYIYLFSYKYMYKQNDEGESTL